MKAFDRLVGRGICYIFLGILITTVGGWLGILCGIYLTFCGLLSLAIGVTLSRKLNQMRTHLQHNFGTDIERIKLQFENFDSDHDGYINAVEFTSMCSSLGLKLTNEERDYAMHMLDKNNDGVIDIYEFTAWFTSRSKQYV